MGKNPVIYTGDGSSIERGFEKTYFHEQQLREEMEKIKYAALRLKEKYKNYEELSSFVDYLRATEEIFGRAKIENWNSDRLKKELIESEINLMSVNSNVDHSVFYGIYSDFQSTHLAIHDVYAVAQNLLAKYANCADCLVLIDYIRDTYILFSDEGKGLEFIKNNFLSAKMKKLSADGEPPMWRLEEVYEDFKDMLTKKINLETGKEVEL
jgi:hypothetical protein